MRPLGFSLAAQNDRMGQAFRKAESCPRDGIFRYVDLDTSKRSVPNACEDVIMSELEKNQQIADSICRDFEWQGTKFRPGEWVALLDGAVVATAPDLDQALQKLRTIEPDPRRGMLVEARESVIDVIRRGRNGHCSLPGGVRGMVGLTFLRQFASWGAECGAQGKWSFFLANAAANE